MTDELARARSLSPEEKRALLQSLLQQKPLGSRVSPASFAQQRLWFLEQLEDIGGTYHIPLQWSLKGPLDAAALRRALDRIVARHESLRTTFGQVDGKPVQRIAAARPDGFSLAEHDLRSSPDAEDELRRLVPDEAGAPFDLEHGPLVRGRLVRVADDEHVLLVTMHHIVSDGWSTGVFVRELGTLYDAFRGGGDDPLPALPTQYADYAAWQRRLAEGELLERQASYWERTLAGAPEQLELPTDHARPRKQDFAGDGVELELDEVLTAALKALSRRHGTTLFMTLLAGWAVVLTRLSGQDEVVVGTPSAGRGSREIEELIGFFVSTLALRLDLSGAPTVVELLGQVRTRALEAQRHQDIPFEQVVERVRPARSLSHTPIFQVMLAWQEMAGGELELPGLAVAPLDTPEGGTAKFDLALYLEPRGERIAGSLEYATALFERETVEHHLGYLRRVLEGMVANERQSVARLPLLPDGERRRLLDEWNATETAYPRDRCVHQLFEAQAARTPGAVAVVAEDGTLTYAELDARAGRLARRLRALGVGPESRVALYVERGAEMVVALLGVLKAGGAYVPLDPSYPADRLGYLLRDCAPAAVLVHGRRNAEVDALLAALEIPVLGPGDDAPAGDDPPPAETPAGADHPAYVMYTSGSTGRPKGVVVPHRGVVNLLRSMRESVGMEPADRMLALTTYAFDISVLEVFLPLLQGARTIVLSRGRAGDPAALADAVREHAPTVMQATPATWRMLVEAGWEGAPEMRALCGGEALPAELASAIRGRVGALWNVYGPTETTIWSTAEPVGGDCADGGQVPIGGPVANTRVYVLDRHGEPVPGGAPGEIFIAGDGVARGYLHRPSLTAERFVPDPFGARPGARMYRTGDRGRWRESAEVRECGSALNSERNPRTSALPHSRTFVLEFLGRTDFQVKLRGFRIEPGEIEARLREHPGVREAVVLAREDAAGEKRLLAYHVGEAAAETLRAHLSASLPAYMVPAAYVRLEALPLTASGKLDRAALPAPGDAAFARGGGERPQGPTEKLLAAIWAEVLGVERVGRRDHFFDLGGHSLLAVRLAGRVREALNSAVTLDDVFEYPTLDALAARLDGKSAWFGTDHAVPVRETGAERPLFVVHGVTGVAVYAQLLRPHLDAEIPVYALSGPNGATPELNSMDDLASRLVRMMAEVQPEGPYRLVGWSAGGLFAYAAAQRLVETGRVVEFVGMLDTHHPVGMPSGDPPQGRLFRVFELLVRESSAPAPAPESLRALRDDTEGQELPAFIAACHARGLLPESVTLARAEQVWNRMALLGRTAGEFVPGPLPVPVHVHLFVTSDEDAGDPRRGWPDMPGGAPIRVERVPGTHQMLMKAGNVEALGATLSRAIHASAAAAAAE